jgi:hypothetical protein
MGRWPGRAACYAGPDSRRILMLTAVVLFAVMIGSVGCPRHVADCPA